MPSRKLSLLDGISIVVGVIIGSGIFLVPANIASAVGTPSSLVLVWLVAGLLSLFGALSFAELGAIFPQAGGQYAYLKEAFGSVWGFFYGWSLFWVAQSGSIAAVGVGFAAYLSYFIPLPGAIIHISWPFQIIITGPQVCAAALIMFLTVLNAIGLNYGALVQNVFTAMKSLACLSIVAVAIAIGPRPLSAVLAHGAVPTPHGFAYVTAFGVAMVAALWAFDGWNNVTFVAAETRNPKRNVPLALIIGTGAVVLIYLLMNLAYLRILDIGQISRSERVAADAMLAVIGNWGTALIAGFIVISSFGCVNGMILAAARVYQAQAQDGLFPTRMSAVHPRFGTPVFSLLTQGIWSALLALSGRYDQLFTFAVFALWVFYGMCVAAIFVFRHRGVQAAEFKVPICIPAVFLVACAALLINTVVETPLESLAGTILMLAGLPVYIVYSRRLRKGN